MARITSDCGHIHCVLHLHEKWPESPRVAGKMQLLQNEMALITSGRGQNAQLLQRKLREGAAFGIGPAEQPTVRPSNLPPAARRTTTTRPMFLILLFLSRSLSLLLLLLLVVVVLLVLLVVLLVLLVLVLLVLLLVLLLLFEL